MSTNPFQKSMQPWPELEAYGRKISLPKAGVDLFMYEAGKDENPPLLLIHGLGDEADTWRHVLLKLSSNYRVMAFDLPGFGRSTLPSQPLTMPFFQSTMLEVMQILGLPRASLLGHSMGGIIAHALALEHPEYVDRLYLLAGSLVAQVTRLNLATLLFLLPGLGEWQYNRLRRDPQAAYRSLEVYYQNLEGLTEVERDFLYQRVNERVWSDTQRDAFLSALRNLARWAPTQQRLLPARLANLQVPTRVIWGEADRVNSIANAYALAELQPSAQVTPLPGAGHNLHQEKPDAILQMITPVM